MSKQYRSFDAVESDHHKTEVYAVHCLESGPTLSGSLDGELKIWSSSSDGASLGSTIIDASSSSSKSPHISINSISSSSSSGQILTSDILGTVALWQANEKIGIDVDAEEAEIEVEGHTKTSWKLHLIQSKRVSGETYLYDGEEGEKNKKKKKIPTCHVTQIHPTRPFFAATGDWAGATIFDCPDDGEANRFGKSIRYIQDHHQSSKRRPSEKSRGAFGKSLTFNPLGDTLAVGTDKGVVSLYDVETKSTLAVLQNHSDVIRALEFTTTGELLVGSDQGSVTLFDLRLAERSSHQIKMEDDTSHTVDVSYVDTLKGHSSWVTDVKAASDARHIASSSVDGQVKVWDLRGDPNRSVVYQTKEEMPVWSLCWKPNAGATSFITGSGAVKKTPNTSIPEATGNVRWYQISGSTA